MLFTDQGRSVLEETALQKNNRAANATRIISSLNNNLTKNWQQRGPAAVNQRLIPNCIF